MLLTVHRTVACAALSILLLAPAGVRAQEPEREPIGWFAADVRGVFARHPRDPAMATFLGVENTDIPTRGLGVVAGAHVYPMRKGTIAFGIGGELLLSRGKKTRELPDDAADDAVAPTVTSRLKAISPQVSLNFGHRQGWSYISGGLGWSEFRAEVDDPAKDSIEPERVRTLNYGGGARWFMKKHVAFTLDLRFYVVSPRPESTTGPALPRTRLLMMSGGVSFK